MALGDELDELELVLAAHERVGIVHRRDVDLRAGQERLDAVDVHEQAAAHLALDEALDDGPLLVALEDGLPLDLLVGELLGEHDHAVVALALDDEHVDLVAGLHAGRVAAEFGGGDGALGLAADVHEDLVGADFENHALDDAVLLRLVERVGEQGVELLQLGHVLLGFLEHLRVPAFWLACVGERGRFRGHPPPRPHGNPPRTRGNRNGKGAEDTRRPPKRQTKVFSGARFATKKKTDGSSSVFEWCSGKDSNLQSQNGTSTSSWRVCQFHHPSRLS